MFLEDLGKSDHQIPPRDEAQRLRQGDYHHSMPLRHQELVLMSLGILDSNGQRHKGRI